MVNELFFKNRHELRDWLELNHTSTGSIWIILNKRDKSGLTAGQALEEALCYGWIDSIIKRKDDIFYVKKFSRRRLKSNWSEFNKKLVGKLIREGKMAGPGLQAIEAAKANGCWDKKGDHPEITEQMISDLQQKLMFNQEAASKFRDLVPSLQKMLTAYYLDAKKEETRERRLKHIIEGLLRGNFLF